MQAGLLRRMDNTGVPLLVSRAILGLVFIGMGWSKAWDPVAFLKLIREYGMIPDNAYWMLNGVSAVLPWIEILCGVLLLAGVLIRGASATLMLMLTVFTIAIAIRAMGIHQAEGTPFCDIHFDCGCGGGDVYMCSKLPENISLWLLTWVGLLSQSRRFCLGKRLTGNASQEHLEMQNAKCKMQNAE